MAPGLNRIKPGGRQGSALPGDRDTLRREFRKIGGAPEFLTFLSRHQRLKELRANFSNRKQDLPKAQIFSRMLARIERTDLPAETKDDWTRAVRILAVRRWLAQRFDGSSRGSDVADLAHLERYFFAAALVPYTAFLNQGCSRKRGSPEWPWIESWLSCRTLRQWWRKHVSHRRHPRGTIIIGAAVLDGALAYLEWRHGGMGVGLQLSKEDQRYLRAVQRHVGLPGLKKYLKVRYAERKPEPEPIPGEPAPEMARVEQLLERISAKTVPVKEIKSVRGS